jgi:hypothetical protein
MIKMDQRKRDMLREIAELSARAQWYREWAKLAGHADERKVRLALAHYIEVRMETLIKTMDSES